MTIKDPRFHTKLEVWYPRYSSKYTETGERVALLARYKVDHGSPIILVEFTKAKHLMGQRFCITREDAQHCPLDNNGTIECYAVPMSQMEGWETNQEVKEIGFGLFPE